VGIRARGYWRRSRLGVADNTPYSAEGAAVANRRLLAFAEGVVYPNSRI
jgi:hypothetical protein